MSILLLDIDGVCADFTRHVIEWAGSDLSPEDITRWDIFSFLTDSQRHRVHRMMKGSEFWTDLPLIEGAQESVERILVAGHEVVVVTTPWESCPTWAWVRRNWVCSNLGIKRSNILTGSRKELVYGDGFIDDRTDITTAWQRRHPGGQAFPFKAPYAPTSTFDWSQVDDVLEHLARCDA